LGIRKYSMKNHINGISNNNSLKHACGKSFTRLLDCNFILEILKMTATL